MNKITPLIVVYALLLSGCGQKSEIMKCLGYADNDVVFVVNADDVGMHKDIDNAVFKLYETKKIQTFSLMVPAPNFSHSAKYALDKNVPVGLHLTLTNEWQDSNGWSPILRESEVPSLYNDAGYMWKSGQELLENADINDIKKELDAQINMALDMGLDVTHLDFHMVFWSLSDEYLNVVLELAGKYKIPVISQLFWLKQNEQMKITSRLINEHIYTPDVFWMYYNPEQRKMNSLLSYTLYSDMFKFSKPAFHHVAIHPSYLTDSSMLHMDDVEFRYDELKIWSGNLLSVPISDNNIRFTNYKNLKNIMSGKTKCSTYKI